MAAALVVNTVSWNTADYPAMAISTPTTGLMSPGRRPARLSSHPLEAGTITIKGDGIQAGSDLVVTFTAAGTSWYAWRAEGICRRREHKMATTRAAGSAAWFCRKGFG